MTLAYLSGNRIQGVSGDTKPSNVLADSVFYETDTFKTFDYSSGSWTERSVGGGSDLELVYDDDDISVTGTTGRTISLSLNRAWYKVFISYYNSSSHWLRVQANSTSANNYSVRYEMYGSNYSFSNSDTYFQMNHNQYTYDVMAEFTILSGDLGIYRGKAINGISSCADRYQQRYQTVFGGVCAYNSASGLSSLIITNSGGLMQDLSIKVYAPKS